MSTLRLYYNTLSLNSCRRRCELSRGSALGVGGTVGAPGPHYYSITVTYNNPVESFIVFTGFFVTENIQGKNVITNFYLESDRTNILLTTGDTRSADNIYPDINPPHHFTSNGVTISYFGMGPSVINLRTEGGSDMLSFLSDGDWIDVIDIDTFFTFNITEIPKLP